MDEILDSVSTEEEKEQAAAQGWKEEPREGFKTAKEFLEFGNKVAPIQKERNEHLAREVAQLKESNLKMQQAIFKAQHDAKEEGYRKAKADLIAEQKRAFDSVDEKAYNEATTKLEKLEPPKVEVPKEEVQPVVDPDWNEWQPANAPWYGTDVAMTASADAIGRMVASSTSLQGKPFFDEVLKRVKKEFPHKFGNQNRMEGANTVEGGGQVAKPAGKKGFAALPADIKAGVDHAMKTFGYKSKDEYAASYWREAEKYGW